MFPHLLDSEEIQNFIKIKKSAKGKSAFGRGAFSCSEKLKIELEISRKFGITKVYLCLDDDNKGEYLEIEIPVEETVCSTDFYSYVLDFKKLCENGDGLFFWKIKLCAGSK